MTDAPERRDIVSNQMTFGTEITDLKRRIPDLAKRVTQLRAQVEREERVGDTKYADVLREELRELQTEYLRMKRIVDSENPK